MPKYRVVVEAIVPSIATIEVDAKSETLALEKVLKNIKVTDLKLHEQSGKLPLRSTSVYEIIA